jgi:ABC-type dipeptide/oligopeptide/nickel transport system permease component
VVLLSALATKASALLVGVAYGWLDPRISYSR